MNWKELRTLCLLPGVASREDAVRQEIVSRASHWADTVRVDPLGNVIAHKRGAQSGSAVMLTAHMDETGVMVTGFTDSGYVKFDFVGKVDRRTVIGKRVYLGERQVPGVFGMKPIHLTSREERSSYPKTDSLYIDIGAKDKQEAQKRLSKGDTGVFAREFLEFGQGLVKSRALGSRVGCAILLRLLREELPVDCTFVFTVQEEVGARGAFGAAFSVKPELALCIDGAAANDLPDVDEEQHGCALRKGAVLHLMDSGALYDRKLFALLRDVAVREAIPWQVLEETNGQTDAMAAQRSRSGCRVAAVSVPVRYAQSPAGVAALSDIEAAERLARAFLNTARKELL